MNGVERLTACTMQLGELGAERLVEVLIVPDGRVQTDRGEMLLDAAAWSEIQQQFLELSAKGPVVFDYEHQSLGRNGDEDFSSPTGLAPAAGWIHTLGYEAGRGLVAKVEWTQRAREMIRAGEYRYVSPVSVVRKSDRRVVGILSAALTNTPAIRSPIERLAAKEQEKRTMSEEPMNPEGPNPESTIGRIMEALGLDDGGATIPEQLMMILEKVRGGSTKDDGEAEAEANKVRDLLKLQQDATTEQVVLSITKLQDGSGSKTELTELREKMARMEQAEAERKADDLVEQFVKANKLNPHNTEQIKAAKAWALKDPEAFRVYHEKADEYPLPHQKRLTPKDTGNPATDRSAMIASARQAFDADPMKASFTLKGYVGELLREKDLAPLTKEEAEKLAV